jgi:hypothetical protein
VKKKPAWASLSDQRCEKEGKIGPRRVVIVPMRTKLVCRSTHSRLRFGAEGEIGDEAIEKGVCHKIDRQTSARNEWIKMAFSIASFIPCDVLMVP